MIVKFYATLREVTGTKEKNVRGYKTVGELLRGLIATFGQDFEQLVFHDDSLVEGTIILVNGISITHLEGLDTPLSENCFLDIFPPVAGG